MRFIFSSYPNFFSTILTMVLEPSLFATMGVTANENLLGSLPILDSKNIDGYEYWSMKMKAIFGF
jgi:hypothetical protein